MSMAVSDYVSRIGVTCGTENDFVVVLRFDKKEEALKRILEKATLKNNVNNVAYDLVYDNYCFRVYVVNGKILFKNIKNTQTLNNILEKLLL